MPVPSTRFSVFLFPMLVGLLLLVAACTQRETPTATPTDTTGKMDDSMTADATEAMADDSMDKMDDSMTADATEAMTDDSMDKMDDSMVKHTTDAMSMMTVESSVQNFRLEALTISIGTTVRWTNHDGAPHTITSGSNGVWNGSGFDRGTVPPGQSTEVTFDIPGVFNYTCTIHPTMNSTITVE